MIRGPGSGGRPGWPLAFKVICAHISWRRKSSMCSRGRLICQVSAVHRADLGARESSTLDFWVAMTAHAIGRAGICVGMLDNEIVVTDSPASLGVAVDLPVAHHEDGQDAEAPGEAGPEAVPTAGFVERAGPRQ